MWEQQKHAEEMLFPSVGIGYLVKTEGQMDGAKKKTKT